MKPIGPQGSERLSALTGAVLVGYVFLFLTGQADDGGGWELAWLGVAFGYYVAPVLVLAAATLAITSRRKRTGRSLALALSLAAAVLVLDVLLMTSRELHPRGPLG